METKHTPGPWKVDKWSGLLAPWFVAGKRNGDGCVIADKLYDEDNEPTFEEVEANARLIAAAPELLAALNAIHYGFIDGSIKFTKRRQSDSDPYHPANTLMSKAFAKVEGRDSE